MADPTVSVILPVYNGEKYVRQAIESVLNQTLQDYELLVIDDGSTDSTPEILRSYGERIGHVRQENQGVAAAVNHGLRLARGKYVSWLSHDDVFEPTKLEMQTRALSDQAGPAVCYTDIYFIDANNDVARELEIEQPARDELLRELVVCGSVGMAAYSLFYDRRCLEKVGLYDESQRLTQDADMLIRLGRHYPFVRVPQKLTRVRQTEWQSSRTRKFMAQVIKFRKEWFRKLPLEELFPHLKRSPFARAEARVWLGDRYAQDRNIGRPIARMQYLKAVAETPSALPLVISRLVKLYGGPEIDYRKFYELVR